MINSLLRKSSNIYLLGFSSLILIFTAGCFPHKKATNARGTNGYETFFVGDGVSQYYVYPIHQASNPSNDFIADYTIRDNYKDTSRAVCNFSILSDSLKKGLTKVTYITLAKEKIELLSLEKLFFEFKKPKYEARYTSRILMQDLKKVYQSGVEYIELDFEDGTKIKLNGDEKANKQMSKLSNYILINL